jgi:hypothetical protein
MDVNQVPMTVQTSANPLAGMLGMGQRVSLPIQMLVNNGTMDQETSITSRLSAIFYLWGTALQLDRDKLGQLGLDARELMWTTENAWTSPKAPQLTQEAIDAGAKPEGRMTLMVMVSGQFPDAFEGQERPAWPVAEPQPGQFPPPPPPTEEGPAGEITPAPGKLVLIGCSEMFRRDFLQASPANLDLFMNSVDAITLGDDLVNVRGKKPVDRIIENPDAATRQFWKAVNYGLSSVVIAVIGIGVAVARRRSRDAYTMTFAAERQ